jgi:hypothetical protein
VHGKDIVQHVREGWELWHVSSDALPGRWELRRGRQQLPVNWDAIENLRRFHLAALDPLVDARQEGRFTWAYVPKQRALAGGLL